MQVKSDRDRRWLPDMDLNHDKQIQSLLCYRYTIGQTRIPKVEDTASESRYVPAVNSIGGWTEVGVCLPPQVDRFNNLL